MKHVARTLALFLLVLLPFGVLAQNKEKPVVLPAGQTVNGVYFGGGGDVRVDGNVNGDAYVAGGTVDINGRINGDLLAAGGTVVIRGPVTQDIRVAGGTVTILGEVGRNVTVAGGTVTIDRGARIRGDVVAGAGTFVQYGEVGRSLTLGAGTSTLAGTISGNVRADAETLAVASGAMIGGNLDYTSSSDANIAPDASISGKINHHVPVIDRQTRSEAAKHAVSGFLWGKLISLAAMYLIGLMFLNFLPRFTESVVATVKKDAWKSTAVGLLAMFLAPFIFVFLLITLIGIPFAFAMAAGLLVLFYIGKIFVAMYIGRFAAGAVSRKVSDKWALFLGLVIHLMITLVPIFGWVAGVFIMFWGAGAVLLTKKSFYQSLRKKDIL